MIIQVKHTRRLP